VSALDLKGSVQSKCTRTCSHLPLVVSRDVDHFGFFCSLRLTPPTQRSVGTTFLKHKTFGAMQHLQDLYLTHMSSMSTTAISSNIMS